MKPFSTEHLLTLAACLAVIGAATAAVRLRPGSWVTPACRLLAAVLVVNECGWWVWLWFHGTYSLAFALPLQLCDLACFVAAAALLTRRPLLVELTYFWGIAGTANGLVTPDLADHFGGYLYFQYFIAHAAIVTAALVLVVGLRLSPRRGAVLRSWLVTVGVLAVDALADLATGGDYLYLRRPPGGHNLLQLLGPWPWYIAVAAVLALALFALLDLPFAAGRARRPVLPRRRSPG